MDYILILARGLLYDRLNDHNFHLE